jgi:hypothetical protein
MSDSSRVQLTYAAETAFAETPPANAAMTRIRLTSHSIKNDNATVVSDELRPDRQRTDLALVGYTASGDINWELTYGNFFDVALQAALCGTWGTPSTDKLRNGTTNRSFRFEVGHLDISRYFPFIGCGINTMDLDIVARRIVTCRVGVMGARGTPGTDTSISGTTALTEPNANTPMRAGSLIAISSAGTSGPVEMVGVSARELHLSINNNMRTRELATQEITDDLGRGVMEITGNVVTYFKDKVYYNQFIANGYFAIRFTLKDPILSTNNAYKITMPSLKVSAADLPVPGNDSDIMQSIPFRALYDAAVGYTIDVERNVDL